MLLGYGMYSYNFITVGHDRYVWYKRCGGMSSVCSMLGCELWQIRLYAKGCGVISTDHVKHVLHCETVGWNEVATYYVHLLGVKKLMSMIIVQCFVVI